MVGTIRKERAGPQGGVTKDKQGLTGGGSLLPSQACVRYWLNTYLLHPLWCQELVALARSWEDVLSAVAAFW